MEQANREFYTARRGIITGRYRFTFWLMLVAILVGGWQASQLTSAAMAQTADSEETLEDIPVESSAGGSVTTDREEAPPTMFQTLLRGGFVAFLIFLLSLVAVGFIVEHFLSIRKSVLVPEHVLGDLDELISTGQIDAAIEYCHQPENYSLASNVVLAGLERYQGSEFGFAEYKSAVEEEGENQTGALYRKTEILGLIGAIAPMLGLTGTVLGMISAFNTIAAKKGAARPDELAGGIGQALVTTLLGLVVAIPAMIAFSFFRNRIDSIVAEAGKRIERIMMPLGRQKR